MRLSPGADQNMVTSQRDGDLKLPKSLHGPPAGYFVVVPNRNDEDGLGVSKLLASLSESWKLVLAVAVLGAFVAGGVSFSMLQTYRLRYVV